MTGVQTCALPILSLSKDGCELFDRVAALALEFEGELMSALTPEEEAIFHTMLQKLEARVQSGTEKNYSES